MWTKFLILFVPFTIFIWIAAPSVKWKIVFTLGGAFGIFLALSGRAMRGVTRGKF